MKDQFKGYYLPSDDEFTTLWEKCIFVLDTNVLLNLYRYTRSTRDDLLKILETVSDRLWIPHQVALEYQDNRLSTILDEKGMFSKVRASLDAAKKKLLTGLSGLQLEKRHSTINPGSFHRLFAELEEELIKLEKDHPNHRIQDQVREGLDKLFEGKVGDMPDSQDKLNEIYKEAEKRFKVKRPPGYGDVEKSGYLIFQGLIFERKYGDYLLWRQILDKAHEPEITHVVFVTEEKKEDWWWEVAGSKIGPRRELGEEIAEKAKVEGFHMYNTEQFMKHAQKHLEIKIDPKSIDQVRDIGDVFVLELESRMDKIKLSHEAKLGRDQFRHSVEGVEATLESGRKLIETLLELAEKHKHEASGFVFSNERLDRGSFREQLSLYAVGCTLRVRLYIPFKNSIQGFDEFEDAHILAQLFDGVVRKGYRHHDNPPEIRHKLIYTYDTDGLGNEGWLKKGEEGVFYSPHAVAIELLTTFIDFADKYRTG